MFVLGLFVSKSQPYRETVKFSRTNDNLCLQFRRRKLSLLAGTGVARDKLSPEEHCVNPGEPMSQRSAVYYEILAYLADHPQAQDTVEGIVEWWLLEQRLKQAVAQVQTALDQLVAEDLVIAREGPTGRVAYRSNRKRLREIYQLLRENSLPPRV